MYSQDTVLHAPMAAGQLPTLSMSIVRSSASGSSHWRAKEWPQLVPANHLVQTCVLTSRVLSRSQDWLDLQSILSELVRFVRCQSPALRPVQELGEPIRHQDLAFDAPKNLPQICASALKQEGAQALRVALKARLSLVARETMLADG